MKKLDGKVAVVTGGNSGIGLATAVEFSREGAKVVISGRDAKTLDSAAKQIGGDVLAVVSDVSTIAGVETLIAAVQKKHGTIDVLFVNAGIARFEPMEVVTEAHFDEMSDINIKGAFFTVQKALPLLPKNASIIFTSSIVNELGMATASVYSATKAAVRSFVRTMAAELISKGIRVNSIAPGPIETPIFGRFGATEQQAKETKDYMTSKIPAGRMGKAEEVARAAVFLASSDSSFTTGAEIPVDGGMSQL